MPILQNDFKKQWAVIEGDAMAAVRRVGASGWYILGSEVEAFERAVAGFCGVRHAVGVANGMDALEIGLRCLGLQQGEKVLTTPLSAFPTTLAILRAGGVPIFVDVDECGAIDLRQCREVLERDRTIRFMMPVHLYGLPFSLSELQRLKDDFEIRIVEDCAQAIGASQNELPVGRVGQVAGTSFYPTKNLGALGDGGALLTDDDEIASRAKALRNYGQSSLYRHDEIGLNSRLDELHAAILRDALLPRLAAWTDARRKTAQTYMQYLSNPAMELLSPGAGAEPVWHLFPVLVPQEQRDAFQQHLRAAGIGTGVHYPMLIPDQKAMKGCQFDVYGDLANARRFAAGEVSLPVHAFLSEAERDQVIEVCNGWQP